MSRTFTFTKKALTAFLDSAFPAPDDSGPIGPFGPIIRNPFVLSALNPQPLPPGPPDPFRVLVFGPRPEPWRAAALARHLIDQSIQQLQLAQLVAPAQSEAATKSTGSRLREIADEFCGTVGPRFPPLGPFPPKGDFSKLQGEDLLAAGLQFQRLADASNGSPLQADLNAAADLLYETGAKRLEAVPQAARAAKA